MLKKCKHDLSSISAHRKSWNIYKKKTTKKSESVTVPKQLKTPEFQNGMFILLIQFIHELAPRSLWFSVYAVFNGIKPLWDEAAFSKLTIFLKY